MKELLIADWELITNQIWTKHGILVKGKSGIVLRNPNSSYNAHEIIPNMLPIPPLVMLF